MSKLHDSEVKNVTREIKTEVNRRKQDEFRAVSHLKVESIRFSTNVKLMPGVSGKVEHERGNTSMSL